MDDELDERWNDLVVLVKGEFRAHTYDPIDFKPDRATLTLRARIPKTRPPRAFPTQLTEGQVRTGNLGLIAAQFFAEYRRARASS